MSEQNEEFETWWQAAGQFGRAGGGDYEKTFAFNAWQAARSTPKQGEALSDSQIEAGFQSYDWSTVPHPFRGSVGFERGARWAEARLAAPPHSVEKSPAAVDFECEDCIGMREHGCYCKAMGAIQPGGPAPSVEQAPAAPKESNP